VVSLGGGVSPVGVKGHDNWIVEFADALSDKAIDDRVLQFCRRHESNDPQFIANQASKVTLTPWNLLVLSSRR